MEHPLELLLARRPELLAYLRRLGASADRAEDLLQSALERGLQPWTALPAPEQLVPWFHRVLRNALIDESRRAATATKALERYAHEPDDAELPAEPRRVCTCTRALLAQLKPEYAQLIELVDVEGIAIETAAQRAGISSNNAYVRLHRARKALRARLESACGRCATGGGRCSDCYCQPSQAV